MPSVVIAAHNEEAVLGRCLDAILFDAVDDEFDVTVVANGCVDGTADIARARRGVRVIETPTPGKASALNLGDAVARGFPRFYLDADILVSAAGIRALSVALSGAGQMTPQPLAVVPRRRLITDDRPILVRAYFAINSRLPVYRDALFGRGLIGLTEAGRCRFDAFPGMVADDLYLDSLFTQAEKVEVSAVETRVETPTTTRDLLRRLVRVRRGNAELRIASQDGTIDGLVRRSDRLAFLRDVVAREPRLAPAGLAYAGITLVAALMARRPVRNGTGWGQDQSTRALGASTEDIHE